MFECIPEKGVFRLDNSALADNHQNNHKGLGMVVHVYTCGAGAGRNEVPRSATQT